MAELADLENTLKKIRNGDISRFYLIFGDEDYLVKQATTRICESLVPEAVRAFNMEQFDGSRTEVNELLDIYNTVPMIPGPRAVLVRDARFFQSKSNAPEIWQKAKQFWEAEEYSASLRQLGKILVLAGLDWQQASNWSYAQFQQELAMQDLSESVAGGPWLSQAILQGAGSAFALPRGGDDSAALLEGLEAAVSDTDVDRGALVFVTAAVDARKKIYKFLQQHGTILDFKKEVKGRQASQTASVFLSNLLKQRTLTMKGGTAQSFLSAYGHDLGLIVRELDKLENFIHPGREITSDDLNKVGSPRPEEDIFELLGALGKKNLQKALPLLRRQLRNEPAPMIMAMLAREIRMLLLSRVLVDEELVNVKNLKNFAYYKANILPQLIKKLPQALAQTWKKNHAFVSFQALTRCSQFSFQTLHDMLERVLEIDLKSKTSSVRLEQALEELCMRFCGIRPEPVY